MRKLLNSVGLLCLLLFITDAHATPFPFNFKDIQGPVDISGNFSGAVDRNASTIVFSIANNGPVASFIRQVYFEYTPDDLLTSGYFAGGTGGYVNFVPLDNDNFPQGNVIGFASDFQEVAKNPGPTWGVNVGETARFAFQSAYALDDIIAAMQGNRLRIGIHVQGIPSSYGGTSDSYVSHAPPPVNVTVPEPATVIILGAGLIGLAGLRRRFRS